MGAKYEVRGSVAVITLDNPPVNGLGWDTRTGIASGVSQAMADPAIVGLVITGGGKAFSGGADIKEFGNPKAGSEPNLLSLIKLLEDCSKPVVAAINGVCMGGGLELALGCHYRLAAPGVDVALPEVKLGLIPGAGGTQRLPRVLGVETALNMIVSGDAVKSDLLASLPGQKLFDQIVAEDLLGAACAFAGVQAAEHKASGVSLPRVRDLKARHDNADAYFGFARNMVKGMAKNFPAPAKCVDAVQASVKQKFDDGMAVEREIFLALMLTPECKALRHAFFGERAAAKIPDVPADTPQRVVKQLAVIGAGTMGGGISMNFLNAGIPVVMLEMKQDALDRGVATIRKNYDAQVKKGKLALDAMNARMALLGTTMNYADISQADLTAFIETLNVDPAIHGILVQLPLPKHINDRAVIEAIAPGKDVDGFHYANMGALVIDESWFPPCTPYGIMKMLEYEGVAIEGRHVVIVGRSNIVGKPMAMLMLKAGGTVTVCHSKTRDLGKFTRDADILVAAVGKPCMITGDMIKPGAVVIDVGINRLPDGKLAGDVDYASALRVAAAITPVPGGVGPMTITMLLGNTLRAAENLAGLIESKKETMLA